ncbi:hypothetical protein M6B38_117455 [Iris pallida]|uniref:Uncharacterized protein n=1 Tax=Iris pallida TaxID=29817 RepID=A0AAX6HSJ4_IRIPA|nr:hypothetical protein M6B38_117455 [Iris pallida]
MFLNHTKSSKQLRHSFSFLVSCSIKVLINLLCFLLFYEINVLLYFKLKSFETTVVSRSHFQNVGSLVKSCFENTKSKHQKKKILTCSQDWF